MFWCPVFVGSGLLTGLLLLSVCGEAVAVGVVRTRVNVNKPPKRKDHPSQPAQTTSHTPQKGASLCIVGKHGSPENLFMNKTSLSQVASESGTLC